MIKRNNLRNATFKTKIASPAPHRKKGEHMATINGWTLLAWDAHLTTNCVGNTRRIVFFLFGDWSRNEERLAWLTLLLMDCAQRKFLAFSLHNWQWAAVAFQEVCNESGALWTKWMDKASPFPERLVRPVSASFVRGGWGSSPDFSRFRLASRGIKGTTTAVEGEEVQTSAISVWLRG